MTQDSLKEEIAALRAQVDEFSERLEGGATDADSAGTPFLSRAVAAAQDSELRSSLEAYLKELGQDVLDAKKGPLVAAFIAGFLAGKISGR